MTFVVVGRKPRAGLARKEADARISESNAEAKRAAESAAQALYDAFLAAGFMIDGMYDERKELPADELKLLFGAKP